MTNPYPAQCFFFVDSSPVLQAGTIRSYRFAFDEYGPRIEMVEGKHRVIIQTFGLQPEDYYHVTFDDLRQLQDKFEANIREIDPQVWFYNVPRAAGIVEG
jgi:hypothetical protein